MGRYGRRKTRSLNHSRLQEGQQSIIMDVMRKRGGNFFMSKGGKPDRMMVEDGEKD